MDKKGSFIFGIWEGLNICVWILNLIFVFNIDCDANPVNVQDWLMVASFVPLGFDLIIGIILIVEKCCLSSGYSFPEESPVTRHVWEVLLFPNLFQIIWGLVGIKVLIGLSGCSLDWLVILNQVVHGLLLIRAVIILKFALTK